MGNKIVKALWGDIKGEELKKFVFLSIGFFFIIGSYWPLKILKDVIFINTVGSIYQPDAKFLSLILFFPLVLLYSKLIDHFSKESMVYLLVGIYGIIGFLFVYYFYHPTIGLSNTDQGPYRLIGWGFYLFVESYISLMVSLFWAFIHDITTPKSAKKAYGMLIFATQFGAVVFTLLGSYLSQDVSLYAMRAPLIALISISMFFVVAFVVFLLKHVVSPEEFKGYQGQKEEKGKEAVGFWDGLKVLIGCPYVGGIFGLVFLHEIVSAIMYYQMIRAVELTYLPNHGLVNKFFFDFTLGMQIIACLFALFGTSFFYRKFGTISCLIAYPVILGIGICAYIANPTLSFIVGVMIIAKGINYVLNQPAKEMLYIPTTKAIKYKSKAWIDMFGMRSAKMTGSFINKGMGSFVRLTSGFSILFIVIWVFLTRAVGTRYRKVLSKGGRIG